MWFGHTGLNSMLLKTGKHNTGTCEFCGRNFNMLCYFVKKYDAARSELKLKLEAIKLNYNLFDQLKQDKKSSGDNCFIFVAITTKNTFDRENIELCVAYIHQLVAVMH